MGIELALKLASFNLVNKVDPVFSCCLHRSKILLASVQSKADRVAIVSSFGICPLVSTKNFENNLDYPPSFHICLVLSGLVLR